MAGGRTPSPPTADPARIQSADCVLAVPPDDIARRYGPILTTVTIAPTANATTYASQTFPISDPGGLHKVYLVFRPVAGGPANNFFNLNWVEFGGQGISIP
jgi:Carbohydrate binding module (family 6)